MRVCVENYGFDFENQAALAHMYAYTALQCATTLPF